MQSKKIHQLSCHTSNVSVKAIAVQVSYPIISMSVAIPRMLAHPPIPTMVSSEEIPHNPIAASSRTNDLYS